MKIKYQEVKGTSYHAETLAEIIAILERIKANNQRVRFHWGNVKTGEDWGDIYGVVGTIGRSTGTVKIPLLINNARSMGGMAILDHCIVKITTTVSPKRVLYQHPKYHTK